MAMTEKITIATPEYWAEACKHLIKKDRVMKRLIPQFGEASLQSRGDAFVTLARSIVGQQISVKAAQSVWNKFAALSKKITPAGVLKLNNATALGGGNDCFSNIFNIDKVSCLLSVSEYYRRFVVYTIFDE